MTNGDWKSRLFKEWSDSDADIIRCRIDLASSSTVRFRPDLFYLLFQNRLEFGGLRIFCPDNICLRCSCNKMANKTNFIKKAGDNREIHQNPINDLYPVSSCLADAPTTVRV